MTAFIHWEGGPMGRSGNGVVHSGLDTFDLKSRRGGGLMVAREDCKGS